MPSLFKNGSAKDSVVVQMKTAFVWLIFRR